MSDNYLERSKIRGRSIEVMAMMGKRQEKMWQKTWELDSESVKE